MWLANEIKRLVREALQRGGYRDLDVRVGTGGRLAVTLDDEPVMPITVEDCVAANRLISEQLSDSGYEPGDYHLEVLSPGADRLLTTPEHYTRFNGRTVVARRRKKDSSGRANFTGTLLTSDEKTLHLEVEGRKISIPTEEIREVRLKADG